MERNDDNTYTVTAVSLIVAGRWFSVNATNLAPGVGAIAPWRGFVKERVTNQPTESGIAWEPWPADEMEYPSASRAIVENIASILLTIEMDAEDDASGPPLTTHERTRR